MSFDVFLQGFRDGDASPVEAATLAAVLEPHVRHDRRGPRLVTADGGADLYGFDDLGSGFMVNHASGTLIWDVLVDAARACDLTIMPIGCPTAVTSPDALAHLPDGLQGDAVVVRSGGELLAVIEGTG